MEDLSRNGHDNRRRAIPLYHQIRPGVNVDRLRASVFRARLGDGAENTCPSASSSIIPVAALEFVIGMPDLWLVVATWLRFRP